jgi:predicted dehydrogenase
MSKKSATDLSVLIVGCGSIGKRHARVLRGLGVKDVRACDPVITQAAALQKETPVQIFSSYAEGLASKPDTVWIGTPPNLHIPMALEAIAAGAHVFCEKPLSDTSIGIDELAETARRAGRSVGVGLCFRYHDGLRQAKAILDSGRFGRLVCVRCLMGENFPTVRPDYKSLYYASHGGAFDLSHEVDLAAWYADRPVKKVQAMAGPFSDIGITAADVAEILIEFEGRCLASIHLDFFQIPRRRQTELICTAGVIIVEFASWDRCELATCGADGHWTRTELKTQRDDMFRAEDLSFLEAVAAGRPVEYGIEEARRSVEIIEQAQDLAGVPLANR